MTTTVLQNILVLSAGQTIQPDARGQAIQAPTVTLLATPEQAETLTLANADGRIQLILRNSSDQGMDRTNGRVVSELYGGARFAPKPNPAPAPRPRVVETAKAAPPPPAPIAAPPPPPPPPDQVVVIRGTQRTVEIVQKRAN